MLTDILVESLETTYEASGMLKMINIKFNTGPGVSWIQNSLLYISGKLIYMALLHIGYS